MQAKGHWFRLLLRNECRDFAQSRETMISLDCTSVAAMEQEGITIECAIESKRGCKEYTLGKRLGSPGRVFRQTRGPRSDKTSPFPVARSTGLFLSCGCGRWYLEGCKESLHDGPGSTGGYHPSYCDFDRLRRVIVPQGTADFAVITRLNKNGYASRNVRSRRIPIYPWDLYGYVSEPPLDHAPICRFRDR
jgi:hypothetical protein